MNVEFPGKALNTATRLLKMMSNPSRLLVLCELLDGEKSVGELERRTSLRQSALSQHLAKLRAQGLVVTRRQSQNIFYSLADTDVDQIIALLHQLFCAPKAQWKRRDGKKIR
jgi:ArsR family transcriptional regulator, virulence genes transcriptional regulator